jgi:hypothetical protein
MKERKEKEKKENRKRPILSTFNASQLSSHKSKPVPSEVMTKQAKG